MTKLNEIVECIENRLENIEYDCSVCPFANMADDGTVKCGHTRCISEDGDYECTLDKAKIREKVIEAVYGENTAKTVDEEAEKAIEYIAKKLKLDNYPRGDESDLEKDDVAFGHLITLEKAVDELKLCKKALEISCRDKAFCDIDQHSTQDFIDMYLSHARKELK